MATGAYLERIGMPGGNPVSCVVALLSQLDQHSGGFFPGAGPIIVPEFHLREVTLVLPASIGVPENSPSI